MGALLFAAGVSNEEMAKHSGDETRNGTPFAMLIHHRYGLTPSDARIIEGANDTNDGIYEGKTPQERRRAVLTTVRELYRSKISAAR
jgi:hypothetical protein